MMSLQSYKERLNKKSVAEINSIAKRLHFPLRGNKSERIHSLASFFDSPRTWAAISK